METRKLEITLEKARDWYNSGNDALKNIALQVFNKKELQYSFKEITSLKKACEALGLCYEEIIDIATGIKNVSKASAAMFKINIIRKALNLGQDLHLTENPENSCTYHPFNPFITKDSICYKSELSNGKMEIIGKFKSEGMIYNVLGGCAYYGGFDGLGCFDPDKGVGYAPTYAGFLGCASKEIAQHFGKHFGMLITEAKYGDMVDFEIVSGY